MDRSDLVSTLRRFTPADLATLVAVFPGAAAQVSRHGTIAEQSSELIRWAESPTGPTLSAIEQEVLKMVGQEGPLPPAPFLVPFPWNPDFVGRSDDLEKLHAVLRKREPVGIRPAGLTGMGGIGKTQLAVEYAYRYRGDYPGGVFWVNAAEPLAQGLAKVGVELRPEAASQSPDQQLKTASKELKLRPNALLVFDNVEDPAQLTRPVGSEPSPLTFACPILFTTRRRDLGRFRAVELTVLPTEPALRLLLRHEFRQPILNDTNHPERPQAEAICRLLGYLPLALELASAFLGEWPDLPLADYRKRLEKKGCLPTLDSEARNLAGVNFQPIHEAAVAATLQTQWEALGPDADEAARLVFRTAGQFTEAAAIPTATLGFFAGVPDVGEPGDPSPLRRALRRLHAVRLVEELLERHVRLHPLVREFSAALTSPETTFSFRRECACRVARAFDDVAIVENLVSSDGPDGLWQCLKTAMLFSLNSEDQAGEHLSLQLLVYSNIVMTEKYYYNKLTCIQFAQHVLFRACMLEFEPLVIAARQRLIELASPYLALRCIYTSSHSAFITLVNSPYFSMPLAYSPDGRHIATGFFNGGVAVWDGRTIVTMIENHPSMVSSVAYSPDGRRIASGASDGTVAVWDAETGTRLVELTGHRGRVSSVAYSPDGRRIASAAWDGTVAVWDAETGTRLVELTGHRGRVSSVAYSPDGRRIASGASDGTVAVWDAQTGRRPLRQLTGHRGRVSSVAYSPDGRRIASGASDDTVAVWDAQTGERLLELTGHRDRVSSVAYSPDGRWLASGAWDNTVAVWDAQTGERLLEFTGHRDWVNSVAFSPDGRWLASGAWDNTVAVWYVASGLRLSVRTGHRDWVDFLAYSPDGRRIASAAWDGTVAVWDAETGTRLVELTGHRGRVSSVAYSPDGRRIASGASDGTVAVWDAETGTRLVELTGHRGRVSSVAYSPDGRRIASSSDDTVAVWDAETGTRLVELTGHRDWVDFLAFSPDGRRIASAADDGIVAVPDAKAHVRSIELTGHRGRVSSVAYSPDGRRIASAAWDDTVAVWDAETGTRLVELTGHRDWVDFLAYSPDGRRIASAADDGIVAVWDAETGTRLVELTGHRGRVSSVAYSPDGRRIASAAWDGTVAVWDAQTGERLATLTLDGELTSMTWHPDGRSLAAGDVGGNVYLLEYREP